MRFGSYQIIEKTQQIKKIFTSKVLAKIYKFHSDIIFDKNDIRDGLQLQIVTQF